LLAHVSNMGQIKVAVDLARRTDADEGQFGILYGFGSLVRRTEPPVFDRFGDEFTDFRLNNGGFTGIDEVDLSRDRVYSDDLMSLLRKASGTHRADVTQTEDADSQNMLLFSNRCAYCSETVASRGF